RELHAGGFQPQVVRVGPAARGDQQMGAAHRLGATRRFHLQVDLAVLPVHSAWLGPQDKADAFFLQVLLQFLGDFCILPWQDVVVPNHYRYVTAEAEKHLPELQADVPTSNNKQVSGKLAQLEDAGVRQVVDPIQAVKCGNGRPCAGVDEDALALD